VDTIEVGSDDDERDHGAQRVVDLVAEDEWDVASEGELEGEGGGHLDGEFEADGEGVEEDDIEPLPPSRRRRTGGEQVQARAPSASTRPDLSSEGPQDFNPRSASSWTIGGTQIQRKPTSSLGRRSRDDPSSEATQDNSRDKRSRVESSLAGEEVPSSPPRTSVRGSSLSLNSDAPSTGSGKPVPRRFIKQEFVPARNQLVQRLAKKLVQAEVLACHPWPNTSTIEGLVRRCWTNAITIREAERRDTYPGANNKPPTKEPDEVSMEIVSSNFPG